MCTKYIILTIALNLALIGCSNSIERSINSNPDEIYALSQQELSNGNWKRAIIKLEELDNNYPFSSYSQYVKLNLIYAYYKNNNLLLAQSTIDRFINQNPSHPNIDYVIYMRGLTNMDLDYNPLQNFFGIDRSNCNPHYAYNAFNDLSKLVSDHPNSKYISDAKKRLILLKNRLAKYEYSVADYYSRRGAWIAVINRIEGILRNYPDTKAIKNGLKLMENAYRQMEMIDQADKVAKIILANN